MLRLILSSLSLCIRQCVRPFAQHGHTFDSGAHGDVCLAGSANAQGVADAPIRPRRADLGLRSAFVLGRPPRRPRRRPFPANTDELAAERMVGPVHQSRVCFITAGPICSRGSETVEPTSNRAGHIGTVIAGSQSA
jgi:hypothetical protein